MPSFLLLPGTRHTSSASNGERKPRYGLDWFYRSVLFLMFLIITSWGGMDSIHKAFPYLLGHVFWLVQVVALDFIILLPAHYWLVSAPSLVFLLFSILLFFYCSWSWADSYYYLDNYSQLRFNAWKICWWEMKSASGWSLQFWKNKKLGHQVVGCLSVDGEASWPGDFCKLGEWKTLTMSCGNMKLMRSSSLCPGISG